MQFAIPLISGEHGSFPLMQALRAACLRHFAFALLFLVSLVLPGEAALAKEAENPSGGLYEEALKRFESEDYRGAIIQLKNVLQANQENLPARILIGRAHLALG
ncbi:MAG: hypothetical protein OXT01_17335, partial [Rhodospirillaceae bacterium]|nr:hypothetical protein [Rhodospirillaceae bacterium]